MNRTVLIGAVTGALALGVLIGALFFRSTRTAEPARVEKAARPARGEDPATTTELARANERLAALETQLRSLQEKVEAKGKDKGALLRDLKDQFAADTKTALEEVDEKDDKPFGWRVPHRPGTVAGLLGLDDARRKTLEDTYWSFVNRIRQLEKEHSKTTVSGKTTRIEIDPFPLEGKALIEDWSAQLGGIFTPDEKDRYKKLGLGLLPADTGQNERVIAIVDEGDGMATSTEQSADGKGAAGWYKGPKGMAVAPYQHLLKK
jgi:hypothetical protein